MMNYLISEAIGDIAGSAYEGKSRRGYGVMVMVGSNIGKLLMV